MVSGFQITLSIALLGSSAGLPSFESFIQKHGRTYEVGSTEYLERQAIYERNKQTIEQQNSNAGRLWTAGVNKLADWTDAEYSTLLGWDGSVRPHGRSSHSSARRQPRHQTFLQQDAENLSDLPKEKEWTSLKMSKEVKNQGPCGSCWAIAAATVLEGHYEIYSGKFRTFSTQQMVSCTPNPRECGGKGGCSGATAELAMEWVLHNGLANEEDVPYTASDTQCTAPNSTGQELQATRFGMTGWETLEINKYEPLVRAIAERGPAVVAAAANTWGAYDSGIFNGCTKDCVVNHAVTAIGYGEENGTKYWLIQNSWGDDWGEAGHIRLFRHDKDSYCGINNDPQAGVACKGETDPVPVCGMCGVLFDSVVPHFKPPIATQKALTY
jgi:cathepsin L